MVYSYLIQHTCNLSKDTASLICQFAGFEVEYKPGDIYIRCDLDSIRDGFIWTEIPGRPQSFHNLSGGHYLLDIYRVKKITPKSIVCNYIKTYAMLFHFEVDRMKIVFHRDGTKYKQDNCKRFFPLFRDDTKLFSQAFYIEQMKAAVDKSDTKYIASHENGLFVGHKANMKLNRNETRQLLHIN